MGNDDTYIKVKTNNSKGFETITEGDSLNYSNPNSKTRRGRVGKGVAQTLDTACEQGVIAAQRGRSYRGQPQQNTLSLDSPIRIILYLASSVEVM